jgi:hypothetical protein
MGRYNKGIFQKTGRCTEFAKNGAINFSIFPFHPPIGVNNRFMSRLMQANSGFWFKKQEKGPGTGR